MLTVDSVYITSKIDPSIFDTGFHEMDSRLLKLVSIDWIIGIPWNGFQRLDGISGLRSPEAGVHQGDSEGLNLDSVEWFSDLGSWVPSRGFKTLETEFRRVKFGL